MNDDKFSMQNFISKNVDRKSIYVCKRLRKKYVKTLVTIEYDLYKKLINLLPQIYDYQRGALSDAINDAIKLWISAHATAHIKSNPKPDIRETFRRVVQYLTDNFYYSDVPDLVPRQHLEDAIMYVRNIHDPRSVLGWLRRFWVHGLIKFNTRQYTIKTAKTFHLVI